MVKNFINLAGKVSTIWINMYSEPLEIIDNKDLTSLNTFGIKSIAKHYCELKSVNQLKELFSTPEYKSNRCIILGGGSNVLFSDSLDAFVIRNMIDGILVENEEGKHTILKVGSGVVWDDFVKYACENGYYGIENLSGIPGSVGASPIQNIGAYGVEVKDVIDEVEYYDLNSGNLVVLKSTDCNFGYRDSIFKKELKGSFIITSVSFKLSKVFNPNIEYPSLKSEIAKRGISDLNAKILREIIIGIRDSKLPSPDVLGNAGSFFKNPFIDNELLKKLQGSNSNVKYYRNNQCQVKIPAAWLIEHTGLKGVRDGNVGTHASQPLVLVNYGGATGEEIIKFANRIQEEVKKQFGISIEPEVNIIK